MIHTLQQAIPLLQTPTEISLFAEAIKVFRDLGPYGLLMGFIFGLYKRWWVMGSEVRSLEVRANKYEELALKAVSASEKATTVAEASITERTEPRRAAQPQGRRQP